jgi:GMP synthase (glutamine-hydrolysing)
MKRILLYKNGVTDPNLVPHIGDYELWFGRVLGAQACLEVHRGFEAPAHPVSGYDAVVMTGSPRSLVTPDPWMHDAAAFVRRAADAGVPVLGVCFGHQLIGWAYGSTVRENPRGWEVGTVEVELTAAGARDPLFRGVPTRLRVNQSHRDEVVDVGPTVTVLASSAHTETQAIAVGTHVRGVQFHPEMDCKVVTRIIHHRHSILEEDVRRRGRPDDDHPEAVSKRTADTPDAEQVLRNFLELFV